MFFAKRIFNRNIILTYFIYFLDCLLSLLTDIKAVKYIDIDGFWLKDTCIVDFYINNANDKGIDTEGTCVKTLGIENLGTKNIFNANIFNGVYIKNT